jgi:hypothetical protein
LARVSLRVRRKASACALPRPSATASAKLANSTVNQSHAAIWPENIAEPFPVTRSRTKKRVTINRHRLGDEDDRVFRQGPRVELAQGVDRRRGEDLAVEQALRLWFRSHGLISDQ